MFIQPTGLELVQVGKNQTLGVGQYLLFHFQAIRFTFSQKHLQGRVDCGQAIGSLLQLMSPWLSTPGGHYLPVISRIMPLKNKPLSFSSGRQRK
jgi:hypothetical protein